METKPLALLDLIDERCAENDVVSQSPQVAADIMDKQVRTLTLDHTVSACIKLMKKLNVRHLPLMDISCDYEKPYFVGIVSQRDVLRVISPSMKEKGCKEVDNRALRQLLAQIVTRKPETVSPDTPISQVLNILLDNHFDMLPVLDGADVIGVITTADILKIFLDLDEAVHSLFPDLNRTAQTRDSLCPVTSDASILSSWVSRTVQDVMTKDVISLEIQDDLAAAIEIMQKHNFRHIPITNEDGKLRGIVSDRDILRHLHYTGKRPTGKQKIFREHLFKADPDFINLTMLLIRIMVRKVTHVLPGTSICQAAKTMRESKVSCLPVLDEQGKLLGILTTMDLISELFAIYGVNHSQDL